MTDTVILGKHGVLSCRYVAGKSPCVLFLHGTLSDKNASKSLFLQQWCAEKGYAYCAFDFTGHGESDGKYTDGTIGLWKQDALSVIDTLIKEQVVIVGSSMGGWIMLLVAMARPERVVGCLGLAAAPDFTVDLWKGFSDEQKKSVQEKGIVYIPNGWTPEGDPWTKDLFMDAENHLLLNKKIPVSVPMFFVQGDKDDCVPVETPFKIKDAVSSENVGVLILKNSGHRLSEPYELEILSSLLTLLMKKI